MSEKKLSSLLMSEQHWFKRALRFFRRKSNCYFSDGTEMIQAEALANRMLLKKFRYRLTSDPFAGASTEIVIVMGCTQKEADTIAITRYLKNPMAQLVALEN